jgi:eukaryotic-like serine/threonine-protein kinase
VLRWCPVIGQTLGNYRVVEKLGEGGMGVVYAAEHTLIGRKAAIKLLLPEYCNNREIVDRFFNEARAAAMIKHEGIVAILDFGHVEDGSAYIVMEFLDGESLTERIERAAPMSEADVIRLTRQTASVLDAAHAIGIVHRDLKPDNMFVVPAREVIGGERVKVLDFGIAKLTQDAGTAQVTRTGATMGSPLYMSPEQCRGAGKVDARSDIYALGCVAYHMTRGVPPFWAEGAGAVMGKHMYEAPEPLRAFVPVSEGLEAIVMCMLAKEPDQRFASMSAVIEVLDQLSEGRFAPQGPRFATPYAGVPIPSWTQPTMPPQTAATGTNPPGGVWGTQPPQGAHGPGSTGPGAVTTTLGGAAAEVVAAGVDDVPAGTRPRWLMPAVLAGVVAVGGAAGFVAVGGKGESARAAAVVTAEPAPVPSPPPEPETVRVIINSSPSGAEVFRVADGVRVGQTPLETEIDKGPGELVYLVKLEGYEHQEVTISAQTGGERTLQLAEVAKRDRKGHRQRSKPGAPEGTPPPKDPPKKGPRIFVD